jgi:hypothetical protein
MLVDQRLPTANGHLLPRRPERLFGSLLDPDRVEIDVENRQFEDIRSSALLVFNEQHAEELLADIDLQ